MDTNQWLGVSQSYPLIRKYTPASVASTNVFTLTAGDGSTLSYTATGTDTVATVCAAILAIINSPTAAVPVPPSFTDSITWAGVGTAGAFTAIQATGKSDGRPFTMNSSATGGSATFTAGTTQSAVSPSDVGLAVNWSLGVPINGQDILIDSSTAPGLLYNLAALAAITPNSFTAETNQQIGLPYMNPAGYVEYLPINLKLAAVTTTLVINNNSRLMNFDLQAGTCTANILSTGNIPSTAPSACNFVHGPTTLNVYGGNCSVAMVPGNTATISGNIQQEGSSDLQLGPGVTVSGTVTVSGGGSTLETFCAIGTITVNGARWTHSAGTVATPTLQNGARLTYNSSSNISGTLIVGPGGCFADFSGNPNDITVANVTVFLGGSVSDPYKVVTFLNPILLNQCSLQTATLNLGTNIQITRS